MVSADSSLILDFPDFDQPGQTEAWIESSRSSGIPDERLVDLLVGFGSSAALVRAAWLLMKTRKHAQAKNLAIQAKLFGILETTLYADAITIFCDTVLEHRSPIFSSGQTAENQIALLIPALAKSEQVSALTPLMLEVQLRLHSGLCMAYQSLGQYSQALVHARQGRHLASSLQMHHSVDACTNLIACQLGLMGLLEQAQEELSEGLREGMRPSMLVDFQRQLAEIHFVGGNFEQAVTLLEHLTQVDPNARWNQVFLAWYGALEGYEVAQPLDPELRYSRLISPLVDGLGSVLQAEALPRTNEHHLHRLNLYQKVQQQVKTEPLALEPYCLMLGQWLRAYANLRTGHLLESLWQIEQVTQIPREWLNVRVLVWGLRLELALHFETSTHLELNQCRHEMEAVWQDAKVISFGNPVGLARRLMRWHSLAAAFLSFFPNTFRQLENARSCLISCLPQGTAWGVEFEPAYTNELVLRSLNIDLSEPEFIEATRNPRIREQVSSLFAQYGQTNWWRPTYSIVPLVFGFAQSDHSEGFTLASMLLRQYGVSAKARSNLHSSFFRVLDRTLSVLITKRLSRGAFFELLPKALQPLPSSAKTKR